MPLIPTLSPQERGERERRDPTMFEIFGIPSGALFGQLLIGLINGSFYALLSLGLAVIFGMLNIINFTHGAQYMMGAFVAFFLLQYFGLNYWFALVVAPLAVGALGVERELCFGVTVEPGLVDDVGRLTDAVLEVIRELRNTD